MDNSLKLFLSQAIQDDNINELLNSLPVAASLLKPRCRAHNCRRENPHRNNDYFEKTVPLYSLSDFNSNLNGKCDPLPLWISTNGSIIEINQFEKKAYMLISRSSRVVFFDFHFEHKEIFWVEEEENEDGLISRIYKSGLQNINRTYEESRDTGIRLIAEFGTCGGLALDWLHSHMYWIHRDAGLIVEATLDGGHRRVVYDKAFSDIHTVAVDPVRRYLFWTERTERRMKNSSLQAAMVIRASDLRGDKVLTLASVEGGTRTLGLDVTERRVYYLEKPTVLVMCDYDGKNKAVVRAGLPRPQVITVSNKQLFWSTSEGEVRTILKHKNPDEVENTFTVSPPLCQRCSHVEKESTFGPQTYLRVVDGRMQPIPDTNHHFYRDCLFNFTYFSDECPCPFGYRTVNLSRTCKEEGYFLLTFSSEIQAISLRGRKLPLLSKGHARLSALDFHYVRGFLFWYGSTEAKIYRSPVLNPSQRQTVALMVRGMTSLAVDWIYDHLFWTSNNRDGGGVEASRLDGSYRLTIVPRDRANLLMSVAVNPEKGTMYIANWTEGSIEILAMDGSPMQRLASRLIQPRSLTLDLKNEKQIYWLESMDGKWRQSITVIKACYLERGEDCRVVYRSLPGLRAFSLAVLDNNLSWLDRTSINVIGVNQKGQPRKISLGKKQIEPHSLKLFHSRVQVPLTNNCDFEFCKGLCVPMPRDWGQSSYRCVQRKKKYKLPQYYASIGL